MKKIPTYKLVVGEHEEFYVCYERYVYEGLTLFGWFKSDKEATDSFRKDLEKDEDYGEYYIGKLKKIKKITIDIPTKEVAIIKIKKKEGI